MAMLNNQMVHAFKKAMEEQVVPDVFGYNGYL